MYKHGLQWGQSSKSESIKKYGHSCHRRSLLRPGVIKQHKNHLRLDVSALRVVAFPIGGDHAVGFSGAADRYLRGSIPGLHTSQNIPRQLSTVRYV